MRKLVLTIFYQFNPWHTSLGGIQAVIRSFVKSSRSQFEVNLVGTGNKLSDSLGVWRDAVFAGKAIRFMPLFTFKDDNTRPLVPTSIQYSAAVLKRYLSFDFMPSHRHELILVTLNGSYEQTLFIHTVIPEP